MIYKIWGRDGCGMYRYRLGCFKYGLRDFGWSKEPLVQSATWQAADGRTGVVLANCADLGESPRVELRGKESKTLALNIDGQQSERT